MRRRLTPTGIYPWFGSVVVFLGLLHYSMSLAVVRSGYRGLVIAQKSTSRRMVSRSSMWMMPEGPEVKTLVDQLQGGVGRRLQKVEFLAGRYARGETPSGFHAFWATMAPATLEGKVDVICQWKSKGKLIYMLLDKGLANTTDPDFQRSIWITLGMTGRFVNEVVNQNDDQHCRWYLELLDVDRNETKRIFYHDARNFGTIKFCLSRQLLLDKLQSLGPDILAETTTENDFVNIVASQRAETNICRFLMDQSKISGIGNYILAEGLYRAGIDPFASLDELTDTQQRMLFRELKATALESYQAQGLTREMGGQYRTFDGDKGGFEFQLRCYGRKFCSLGNPVYKDTKGPHGRTIWYTDEQLFVPRHERSMSARSNVRGKDSQRYSGEDPTNSETVDAAASVERLSKGLHAPCWTDHLHKAMHSDSFRELAVFLDKERSNGIVVYPSEDEIFSALNLTPFSKVKVVIVGQDPYHGPGQGHGLAFSVRKGVKPPPSLLNIFREVMDDVGIQAPQHGNLEHWAKQGVLLLNTVLTVQKGVANSHAKRGWEEFTDAVVRELNENRERVVFLLWGNPAAKKGEDIDTERHTVIRSSHPSPLGATKTASPFLGSRCFSRANAALIASGQEPIDWSVE